MKFPVFYRWRDGLAEWSARIGVGRFLIGDLAVFSHIAVLI